MLEKELMDHVYRKKSRFFAKNSFKSKSGCILWLGARRAEYGLIKLDNHKSIGAHRFSYLLHNGYFDQALEVCHRCDNPSCVNPEHLFLASHKDNMRDCMEKGRFVCFGITTAWAE